MLEPGLPMPTVPPPRPRTILHVDMDAFFAAVEQRDRPELRGKPVIVGADPKEGRGRGVVSTASYEARRFGVGSAMPISEAWRRCPHGVYLHPDMEKYARESDRIMEIFHRFTDLVEPVSIDEAFLDVTASRSLFGDGETIAQRIKEDVKAKTGLTASAGVAPCKFAAKIASDMEKPDGLTVVRGDVAAFLAPLPIERMWGIGPKTAPRLRGLGYHTLGDLAAADPKVLERVLGAWGPEVRQLARGHDARAVVPDREAKSISAESTYEDDLTDREAIARSLLGHASRVAERLTQDGLAARAVMVKLKYHDFVLLTRRSTLPTPASDTRTIHDVCLALLDRFPLDDVRVRLTGVAAQEIVWPDAPQKELFPDRQAERRREIENVVVRAKDRFGGGAITFATLLEDTTPRAAPEGDLEAARKRRPRE
jgi:DNA polymerase-4